MIWFQSIIDYVIAVLIAFSLAGVAFVVIKFSRPHEMVGPRCPICKEPSGVICEKCEEMLEAAKGGTDEPA